MIEATGRDDNHPKAPVDVSARDRGAQDAPTTVSDALASAAARLRVAGVDDPRGDARRLLAEARGRGPDIASDPAALVEEDAMRRFERMIAARVARKPVAQIIGRRAFWRAAFDVTTDVLDPRPESEALVEAALEAAPADAPVRVLDLGVGSGCLLLSVLGDRPQWSGLGVDLSAAALRVAARNAERLRLSDRARFVRGDWSDGLDERFNVVLCNPPYISEQDLAALSPEVRLWEPRSALSPPDGDPLSAYRRVAAGLDRTLAVDGAAFFEVGAGAWDSVASVLKAAGFVVESRRDLGGALRVAAARRAG